MFSISSDAPGPQVDAAYQRQSRINDRLGGKMVAAYLRPGLNIAPDLLTATIAAGFEPLVVAFADSDQFDGLIAEIEEHGLWDPEPQAAIHVAATLMATPFGFRRIATGDAFAAWLPVVDEINIAR